MEFIETEAALEALYGRPAEASQVKVADRLVPAYRRWVETSRFCVLTTVGPEGTDGSPRGDAEPVVTVLDDRRLALPDWRGNNRLDSLRNIVRDGRVSLMFMVPGSDNVLRVNGRARLTADAGLCARFERAGRVPVTVVVVDIAEVYFQCARAVMRAGLWDGEDHAAGLPTAGEMLAETKAGFDGESYDRDWPGRARESMW